MCLTISKYYLAFLIFQDLVLYIICISTKVGKGQLYFVTNQKVVSFAWLTLYACQVYHEFLLPSRLSHSTTHTPT